MSMYDERTMNMKDDDKIPGEEVGNAVRDLCRQIHIIIPYRGSEGVHGRLSEMSVQWVLSGIMVTKLRDPFGGFIERTRNFMVNRFLKGSDRKFLIMLDNDVVPKDPGFVVQLASHNLPVVTGVACAYRPEVGIHACFAVKDPTGTALFPSVKYTKTMPAEGLREVESCGTGFVCIRRDVLETIRADWFTIPREICIEADAIGELRKGEDICFSDRVRKAGHKLHVDFVVQCWHDKVIPLHWPPGGIDATLDSKLWDATEVREAVKPGGG